MEKILANNVDRQKWIHGETTFLTTGDYPTVDLSDRLLPTYKIRGHFYHDDVRPGCSQSFTVEDGYALLYLKGSSISEKNFFLNFCKKDFSRVILCEKSIARIPEA
jgi:hypothetical protein